MRNRNLLFIATFFMCFKAYSTVLTVNNSSVTPGQYNSYAAAEAAASVGDTIYLSGTSTSYGAITISKSISLIGSGHHPNVQFPLVPFLGSIEVTNGLNNVFVSGLKINGQVNPTQGNGISNFTLNNCWIGSSLIIRDNSNAIVISGNVFNEINDDILAVTSSCNPASNVNSVLVQNNFFRGAITRLAGNAIVINHNLFLSTGIGNAFSGTCGGLNHIAYAAIKNNIFYNANPINAVDTLTCTFENNITYNTFSTYPSLPGSNINNSDPLFISYSIPGFSYTNNYYLQTTSPGHNAATNGSDIGIYGGAFPFTLTGEPSGLPIIRKMDVLNDNVQQNGNLNVKVRSTKSR